MKNSKPEQIKLIIPDLHLPSDADFPINSPRQELVTEKHLKNDFEASSEYLIITGFSSLDYLIRFFNKKDNIETKKVRVVLGNEPQVSESRNKFFKDRLNEEIKDYWLDKGVSIVYGGNIIYLIELIKKGIVDFRYLDKLHGKLYVGNTHAIIGSSNFSGNGLRRQFEANKRCSEGTADYIAIQQIAEFYYKESKPFNTEMIGLLEQLLKCVSWQEALSRAISELLEGNWIKKYPQAFSNLQELNLWGVQIQAIGQALYILDNHGSLLVADPTGAGKTRLGVALKLAMLNRLWMNGRGHRSNTLLLCPSSVKRNWQKEADQVFYNNMNIVTHAQISDRKNSKTDGWKNQLTKTNILFIDEAHNFLRRGSKRSKNITLNNADNIILLTATPINKKEQDLFRLIEIMDVDNLSDEVIVEFEKVRRNNRNMNKETVELFRQVLRNFTIRRTKKDLNKIIDKSPEKYLNRLGQQCRFPIHNCITYTLDETKQDIALMEEINLLVKKLKGLIWLKQIWLKPYELKDEDLQAKIVKGRINASAGLAAYYVQNRIRSSRAALVEHLKGSNEAKIFAGLKKASSEEDKEVGNILDTLEKLKEKLPKSNVTVPLPEWFMSLPEYQKVLDQEIKIYNKILVLTKQMSSHREMKKAAKLELLLKKHKMILAFDSRLISLDYINYLIHQKNKNAKTIVVTGQGGSGKKEDALEKFGLESDEKGWIGLCSDAMAEGVNMQKASALVFLDMPSVMRLAEQRIGRIDRMDSPHKAIEIYWVDDHDAFALRTDKKFFETAETVKNIIGSNIELPEEFSEDIIKANVAINLHMEKLENEERYSDGIQDAFRQVRNLKEDESSLINPKIYEQIRTSKANVYSHVSFVSSETAFGFFALKGSENNAPRWFLIEGDKVSSDLSYICERLRDYLPKSEDQKGWTDKVTDLMDNLIRILKNSQIDNLPNKKRRALQLLKQLIGTKFKKKDFSSAADKPRLTRLIEILNLKYEEEDSSIDYYQFAVDWIDIVQPFLNEQRQKMKKLVHLGNIFRTLKALKNEDLQFEKLENSLKLISPLDKRIAACIIGIPVSA